MFQHCPACPADRRTSCGNQGCHAALAELRVAAVAEPVRGALLKRWMQELGMPRLEPGELRLHPDAEISALDASVDRLDVEEGDIVVVRTRSKLSVEKAARWQGGLERLLRAQGYREVGVLILDDCSDVTVEKRERSSRFTIRKTPSMGKTEQLLDVFVDAPPAGRMHVPTPRRPAEHRLPPMKHQVPRATTIVSR